MNYSFKVKLRLYKILFKFIISIFAYQDDTVKLWPINIFIISDYSINVIGPSPSSGVVARTLLSNLAVRVRFPAGLEILISILGLCVYPSSVFCRILSLAVALILRWSHIQGGPPLCICLVFWSTVCCSPYRILTHGLLGWMSRGCESYIGGG